MRSREQGGFTLIEVLVAMVVSMAIVVPLMAWIVLGFRQQGELQVTSRDDNAVNFLSSYLSRDIASASTVQLGGTDCSDPVATPSTTLAIPAAMGSPGASSASITRTVLLTLNYSGDDNVASRTVYVVDEATDGGTLRRRTCDLTGAPTSDRALASGLATPPGGWAGAAASAPVAPAAGEECRRVTMTLTRGRGGTSSISATRRTTNPLPTEPAS